MDDLYFSDRTSKNRNRRRADLTDADDIFSIEQTPEPPQKKEPFVVHIPENERSVLQPDRRPKGQPLAAKANTVDGIPEYKPAPPISGGTSSSRTARSSAAQPQQPQQRQPQQRQPQQRPAAASHPAAKPAAQRQPQQPQRSQRSQRKQPPKKKKRSKAIIILVLVFVLLFGGVAGLFAYGYSALGHLHYDKTFKDNNAYIDESTLMTGVGVKNILLLGSDARGDVQGQRSDTMLLCSIDAKHHKVKLTSFLRDSYVYIPSKDYRTKLNAAFSYGGPQLLIDTLEYNFKIKIDGYILIDFEGFTKLIDLMGGLDIDGVTEAEAKYLRDKVKIIYAKEGTNHFSGAASLWYCRIRYLDNDFKRTERQRKVIGAIVNQAAKTKPARLKKIINKVLPMISTSLTRSEVLTTGLSAVFNYIGGENPQHQVPAEGTWSNQRINGADVLKMDEEENIRLLKEFIYE